jgi:hypothetical protein
MLLRILGFSLVHFVAVLVAAVVAFGFDLDQLRSRSAVSRVAGVVHDFLMVPHDALIRSLPRGTLGLPGLVPALMVLHSLAWGGMLYALWRFLRTRQERRLTASSSG